MVSMIRTSIKGNVKSHSTFAFYNISIVTADSGIPPDGAADHRLRFYKSILNRVSLSEQQ